MLCEHEVDQLVGMVNAYGLKGVIDALATEAEKRSNTYNMTAANAYGHDAKLLKRVVRQLWVGGKGKP